MVKPRPRTRKWRHSSLPALNLRRTFLTFMKNAGVISMYVCDERVVAILAACTAISTTNSSLFSSTDASQFIEFSNCN